MKVKDIRAMSGDELAQKEKALKKQLYDLRYQRKIGRVEKPSLFKNTRKDIARILTILQERQKDGTKAK
jgi:large subunit ribosomal protein L29